MRRGCLSDRTDDSTTCTQLNEECSLCSGSACNTQPATTQSTLSCIKCSNNAVECAWGYTTTESAACSPTVVFPHVESCFTFTHDNGTVTRGCTLDNESLCGEGDQRCSTCSGVGCNTQNVVTQSCKVCRSNVIGQENCGQETFNGLEQECGTTLKYEDRGCYVRREDNIVVRGCAATLSSAEVSACRDSENDQCIYCTGDNCNVQLPSSDAPEDPDGPPSSPAPGDDDNNNNHAATLQSLFSLIFTVLIATMLLW